MGGKVIHDIYHTAYFTINTYFFPVTPCRAFGSDVSTLYFGSAFFFWLAFRFSMIFFFRSNSSRLLLNEKKWVSSHKKQSYFFMTL